MFRPMGNREKVPQPTHPCTLPHSALPSSCTHHFPDGCVGMVGSCGDELQRPCRRRQTQEPRRLPQWGGAVSLHCTWPVSGSPGSSSYLGRVRPVALQMHPTCWGPTRAPTFLNRPLLIDLLLQYKLHTGALSGCTFSSASILVTGQARGIPLYPTHYVTSGPARGWCSWFFLEDSVSPILPLLILCFSLPFSLCFFLLAFLSPFTLFLTTLGPAV